MIIVFGINGEFIDCVILLFIDFVLVLKGGEVLILEEFESIIFGIVVNFDSGLFIIVDYYNIEVIDCISIVLGIELIDEDIVILLE